jgi:general secretion pathway protein I
MSRYASRPRGFSLLELLVALAIMSLSLGVLYRAVGGGVRTVGDMAAYNRAVAIGESLLAARETVPAAGVNESGDWQGYRWSLVSSPFEAAAPNQPAVHRVQVDVGWSDGMRPRSLSLASLRPQSGKPAAGSR